MLSRKDFTDVMLETYRRKQIEPIEKGVIKINRFIGEACEHLVSASELMVRINEELAIMAGVLVEDENEEEEKNEN